MKIGEWKLFLYTSLSDRRAWGIGATLFLTSALGEG